MTRLMEGKKARAWHTRIWSSVKGSRVLEAGVGTGRSFSYYPGSLEVTAVDLSEGMLARAKQRAQHLGLSLDLRQMDVQKLASPDDSFDTAVATCTFCSVPDPVLDLQEIRRTLKPDGSLILLERMRHDNRVIGFLMDCMNPAVVRLMGTAINRRTLGTSARREWKSKRLKTWPWVGY